MLTRCRPWATLAVLLASIPACEACDSCDRSTRKSSYQEPDQFIKMPGGWILFKESPRIPEHLRANCHVCPEWCTQADLRPLPIDVVISQYRRHAVIYLDETRKPRWPDGWARLEQLACIVAGGGPILQQRFVELLRDPDPAIRYPVALHTLQYSIDEPAALATLRAMAGRELADGPDGPDYASRAYFVLTEYEIGNPIELP